MTFVQRLIIIGLCVLGTVLTRFLPFLVFSGNKEPPAFVKYLGKALPGAVFGMLVIYCLKNVELFSGAHGVPEFVGLAVTVGLHLWKKQMLLSIFGGTLAYMLLLNFVF